MENQTTVSMSRKLFFSMALASALCTGFPLETQAETTNSPITMQQQIVKGTVVDGKGTPVIGANVQVKGTKNGTITDMDGHFSLTNAQGTLQISYIGFHPTTVNIQGNEQNLQIVLKENTEQLDEVVVIGYGTQKKSDLTGAITSIKSSDLAGLNNSNAAEALQGKSGLTVTSNAAPGSSPVVKVRGVGTNGDSSPLYVVDGMMVNDIQFLNPDDIVSMDVLKDASATAIYGSRGANGVIMVTTRQGKTGKPTVSYNGSEGFQFIVHHPDIANATQYAELVNMASRNQGEKEVYSNPAQYGKGTDWLKEATRNGWVRDHSLSLSGGSERVKYNLSIGYFSQKGIFKYTDYDRLTLRINNEYTVNKRVKIGHNLSFTYSDGANDQGESSIRINKSILGASPLISPKTKDGEWSHMQEGTTNLINPVADLALKNSDLHARNYRFVGNVWGTLNIMNGLDFRTSFGMDWGINRNTNFIPAHNINASHQMQATNKFTESYGMGSTWLWENTLTYQHTFNEIHRLNVLAGFTAEHSTPSETIGVEGLNYISDNLDYVSATSAYANGALTASKPSWDTPVSRLSYMFRANYTLKDRYLFTATIRADGSSKFGSNNRWGYFPSAAIGWRMSEESFLKDIAWLDNLKLRGSWGQTGNDKITSNVSYALGSQNAEYHAIFNGSNYRPAAAISTAYNPNIKWERTEQLDFGFDLGVFQHLTLNFDWYLRNTKDLLMVIPFQGGSTGLNPTYSNVGAVRNQGVELTLRYQNYDHEFKYGISVSGNHFTNEITDWGGQITYNIPWTSSSQVIYKEGLPLGTLWGYDVSGVYRTQADIDYWNNYAKSKGQTVYKSGVQPGDAIYRDVNGDGTITDKDMTNLGCPFPKFTGSVMLDASYKGFDLALNLTGSFGRKIMNDSYTTTDGPANNMHVDWLNSWTPENPNAALPALNNTRYYMNTYNSLKVQNGDYLKISSVELGYTLPSSIMKRMNVSRLRIYVNATNPVYWTKYKGFTPEFNYWTGSDGVDIASYPMSGSFKVGINLTF